MKYSYDKKFNEKQKKQFDNIAKLLKIKNAKLISHFYVPDDVQYITEKTGGIIADSLKMAEFGKSTKENILIIAGVKFMGETAKIISPEKRILMPNISATCSLDIGCPEESFKNFCKLNKGRKIVIYANTSARIKACADWIVTSSNAIDIVNHLHKKKEKIIWAPDKYLGNYIKKNTGVDMISWNGSCIVHEEFNLSNIKKIKTIYPNAKLISHPESSEEIIKNSDFVGSTTKLLKFSQYSSDSIFIVATEKGLLYKMKELSPQKTFILASHNESNTSCTSCGICPWMKMNNLTAIEECLKKLSGEIILDSNTINLAKKPINRMLNFYKNNIS